MHVALQVNPVAPALARIQRHGQSLPIRLFQDWAHAERVSIRVSGCAQFNPHVSTVFEQRVVDLDFHAFRARIRHRKVQADRLPGKVRRRRGNKRRRDCGGTTREPDGRKPRRNCQYPTNGVISHNQFLIHGCTTVETFGAQVPAVLEKPFAVTAAPVFDTVR